MSLDPSHCGCDEDVCPWGCWQAGWVSLPQLGQQGPAHLTTGTQSSSRDEVFARVLVGSWFWLWVVDPKGADQAHFLGDPPQYRAVVLPSPWRVFPLAQEHLSPKPALKPAMLSFLHLPDHPRHWCAAEHL